jgi:hypothetical protein
MCTLFVDFSIFARRRKKSVCNIRMLHTDLFWKLKISNNLHNAFTEDMYKVSNQVLLVRRHFAESTPYIGKSESSLRLLNAYK